MKIKRIILLIGILVIIVLSFVVGRVSLKIQNIKQEYTTAEIIRLTTEFVKSNKSWPKSWEDLKIYNQDIKNMVKYNFNIDINNCDTFDIIKSIEPNSGVYLTYPHSMLDMEILSNEILTLKNKSN